MQEPPEKTLNPEKHLRTTPSTHLGSCAGSVQTMDFPVVYCLVGAWIGMRIREGQCGAWRAGIAEGH